VFRCVPCLMFQIHTEITELLPVSSPLRPLRPLRKHGCYASSFIRWFHKFLLCPFSSHGFQDMERIRTLGRELRTIFSPEPVRVFWNHLPRLWPGGCHYRQCVGHLRWEALVRRCPNLGNGWKWAVMAMEAAKTMRFFEFHPA
jgi:hypothetical protein